MALFTNFIPYKLDVENPMLQFEKDGYIDIPQDAWKALNEIYDKERLRAMLTEKIVSGRLVLPLKRISRRDAEQSFYDLCNYKVNPYFEDKVITRFDYKYELGNKYIDEDTTGGMASNYFQQANRYVAEGHANPSPVRTWASAKFLQGMLKAIWTLKCDKVDDGTFRTCIALRKYTASQFKPAVAKSIYTKFNAVDVIDFSSGWGDRLCGFYATSGTRSYIGIDPNKSVYDKYFEQIDMYKSLTKEKSVTLYNECAENVTLPSNSADLVFTSPPYFNAEKYVEDERQAFKKYRTIDSWLENFMYPTLNNVWNALKRGGGI